MEQPKLLGEEAWIKHLEKTVAFANDLQDRIGALEQCSQAVSEEPYSPRLWQIYGDWMWILYKRAHDVQDVYQTCQLEQVDIGGNLVECQIWTDEDMHSGKEVFQWGGVLDIWRQGAEAVQWHMDLSNLVWDPYLELRVYGLSAGNASFQQVHETFDLFRNRLEQPHRTWDNTRNNFSTFVSRYAPDSYNEEMIEIGKKAQKFQSAYETRRKREFNLRQAALNSDFQQEKSIMRDYLEWEEKHHSDKPYKAIGKNIFLALFQRATLRFPDDADFWLDYIMFHMQHGEDKSALLQIAERATKHCPGSGELWAKRLYAMEFCGRPYTEIETVKHTATSTGQIEDAGNMEELIKVDFAWCSYLRRTAFASNATADSRDVAEVAIRSAIENVARVGRNKYGDAFRGDPEFRVERIYLKFLVQSGEHEECREVFRKLEATHGDSHFFWERWYLFEMTVWESSEDRSVQAKSQSIPTLATAALKRAMYRPNLDWPEKVIDNYLHHCAQHETVQALMEAEVEARRVMKGVKKLREQQASHAAEQQTAYQSQKVDEQHSTPVEGAKRSREDTDVKMSDPKRQRRGSAEERQRPKPNDSSSANAHIKRDREHTSVIVRHLPSDVDESAVKKFFRDCGEILEINLVRDEEHAESTATVEFKAAEDVLTALTKTLKTFGDKSIDVKGGTGTTLWVTNYPPSAGETYIRDLFGKYGDIVGVRFPNLEFNRRRRFCYVQFLTAAQASEASIVLNGAKLEENFELIALVSDPHKKKVRVGATLEGRELCVRNVERTADESDLRQFFSSYGHNSIESIRLPRDFDGKGKSVAFIVFQTQEEADTARQKTDKQLFRGRVLSVIQAVNDFKKHQAKAAGGRRRASQASDSVSIPSAGSPAPHDTVMGNTDTSAPLSGIASESSHDRDQHAEGTLALPNKNMPLGRGPIQRPAQRGKGRSRLKMGLGFSRDDYAQKNREAAEGKTDMDKPDGRVTKDQNYFRALLAGSSEKKDETPKDGHEPA